MGPFSLFCLQSYPIPKRETFFNSHVIGDPKVHLLRHGFAFACKGLRSLGGGIALRVQILGLCTAPDVNKVIDVLELGKV